MTFWTFQVSHPLECIKSQVACFCVKRCKLNEVEIQSSSLQLLHGNLWFYIISFVCCTSPMILAPRRICNCWSFWFPGMNLEMIREAWGITTWISGPPYYCNTLATWDLLESRGWITISLCRCYYSMLYWFIQFINLYQSCCHHVLVLPDVFVVLKGLQKLLLLARINSEDPEDLYATISLVPSSSEALDAQGELDGWIMSPKGGFGEGRHWTKHLS